MKHTQIFVYVIFSILFSIQLYSTVTATQTIKDRLSHEMPYKQQNPRSVVPPKTADATTHTTYHQPQDINRRVDTESSPDRKVWDTLHKLSDRVDELFNILTSTHLHDLHLSSRSSLSPSTPQHLQEGDKGAYWPRIPSFLVHGPTSSLRTRKPGIYDYSANKGLDISKSNWWPHVDVHEREQEYIVHVELPGMKKEEITVEFEGNKLIIKGERIEEKEEGDKELLEPHKKLIEDELKYKDKTKEIDTATARWKWHMKERSFGTFIRVIELPATFPSTWNIDAKDTSIQKWEKIFDMSNIKAKYHQGILIITIPKTKLFIEEVQKLTQLHQQHLQQQTLLQQQQQQQHITSTYTTPSSKQITID